VVRGGGGTTGAYELVLRRAEVAPLFLGGEGSYLINVSRQQNTAPEATPTSGRVTVSLVLQRVETQPIEIGATANGTPDESNPSDYYRFRGAPDDLLLYSFAVSQLC
jgi:hypothetical protein